MKEIKPWCKTCRFVDKYTAKYVKCQFIPMIILNEDNVPKPSCHKYQEANK